MREILGNQLEEAFKALGIIGKKTYTTILKYGIEYSIYQLEDDQYEKLCDTPDELWLDDYGFWRGANGCNLSQDEVDTFEINKQPIIAFLGSFREDLEIENASLPEEDRWEREKEYGTLLEYLCDEIGASQERNIIAIAIDLAKMNDMSVSELFTKYQG